MKVPLRYLVLLVENPILGLSFQQMHLFTFMVLSTFSRLYTFVSHINHLVTKMPCKSYYCTLDFRSFSFYIKTNWAWLCTGVSQLSTACWLGLCSRLYHCSTSLHTVVKTAELILQALLWMLIYWFMTWLHSNRDVDWLVHAWLQWIECSLGQIAKGWCNSIRYQNFYLK